MGGGGGRNFFIFPRYSSSFMFVQTNRKIQHPSFSFFLFIPILNILYPILAALLCLFFTFPFPSISLPSSLPSLSLDFLPHFPSVLGCRFFPPIPFLVFHPVPPLLFL